MNSVRESCYNLEERLVDIFSREKVQTVEQFFPVVQQANEVLINENPDVRPRDANGRPGGLVRLKKDIETIIVPDLHGRMHVLMNLLLKNGQGGFSNLQRLCQDELQIICLGDGMHAEGRAAERWKKAADEFRTEFKDRRAMDEEMCESFGIMEMVMVLKQACPDNFHFLKGNHENISNESGNGNHAFMKYSFEGAMVAYYVEKFYGVEFMNEYYTFEKNLPLFAVGRNFLISHAEPAVFYTYDEILNYRSCPYVVEGLTWTNDGDADEESVLEMISAYIDDEYQETSFYFGGHRPVRDLYKLYHPRRYVQIHNPDKFIIAKISPIGDIDLDRDIIEL